MAFPESLRDPSRSSSLRFAIASDDHTVLLPEDRTSVITGANNAGKQVCE